MFLLFLILSIIVNNNWKDFFLIFELIKVIKFWQGDFYWFGFLIIVTAASKIAMATGV